MRFSLLSIVIVSSSSLAVGFVSLSKPVSRRYEDGSMVALEMVKKMRNKQAELAKKLAAAKEQNLKQDESQLDHPRAEIRLSDRDLKELNDRRRFEALLEKQTASLNFVSSDGYLSREQEEAEIDAYRKSNSLCWISSIREPSKNLFLLDC
jgi:hypothetical protein